MVWHNERLRKKVLEKGEVNSFTQCGNNSPSQRFRNMFSHPQEFSSGIFHSSEAGLFLCVKSVYSPLRTGFSKPQALSTETGWRSTTHNAIPTLPFISLVHKLKSKVKPSGISGICDTVCVGSDVCIKTN